MSVSLLPKKTPNLINDFLRDSYGRVIRDLRVSITEKCNFRCTYCIPDNNTLPNQKSHILSLEEILYLVSIFTELGITKIRITGGEPLLRRGVVGLITDIAKLPKLQDIALTTNGYYLSEYTSDLIKAGLNRVTISLDSLNSENFKSITKVDALPKVLESINVAKSAGLNPVKINCVLVRGVNDDEIEDFANFARHHDVSVRFIEYMPLDGPGEWNREKVVPGHEIYERINKKFSLTFVRSKDISETARRYIFTDNIGGEIGIIAPVTEPFCGACSRIRLTADGKIRTCLFSLVEHDLLTPLRNGATRSEITELIFEAVSKKEPRHYINDSDFTHPQRTMSCIGG